MLLHISAPEQEGLFTQRLESRSIYTDFLSLAEIPNLKTALATNRAMPVYDFVLFHFTGPPPGEELEEAVAFLRRFHRARILVFTPAGPATDVLFGRLHEQGLRELVAYTPATDLISELEQCISPEGKAYQEAVHHAAQARIAEVREKLRPGLELPPGRTITIGLAGAQSRVGTTTQTFGCFHALREWGATPCIVDPAQELMALLLKLYPEEAERKEGAITLRGVTLAHDILSGTEHNIFLVDEGLLTAKSAAGYFTRDLRLLCAGGKPWELPHLAAALQEYPGAAGGILLSFVPECEEEELRPLLQGMPPVHFAPWQPDIWRPCGLRWYEAFLLPLLQDLLREDGP